MGKIKFKSIIYYVFIFFIIGSILGLIEASLEDFLKGGFQEVFKELHHFHHYTSIMLLGLPSSILGLIAYFLTHNLKISKTQLEQERNQLLSIFDSIEESIYVSDLYTNKILFANKYLTNILGFDPVGKICFRALQEATSPCEFCTNNKILELDGAPYHWNYFNEKLNKHFCITDRIISWSDKRKVRFEIAVDVTEQVNSKSQALEKTELLNSFMQSSPDFVFIWDKDLNLVEINEVGLTLFSEEKDELIGKHIDYVFRDLERSTHFFNYADVLKTENTLFYNHTITTKNGDTLYFSVRVFQSGENIGQVATDITSLVLAEEDMKHAIEDLSRSNKDLEQFAYIASHDLKAPLRNIHSLAEWLLTEYKEKLDDKGVEYLEIMLSRVIRMNNFIDGILNYAKLDLNKDTYSTVNLRDIIEEVLSSITIPEHISIHTSDHCPQIHAKKILIEQVFLNLIDNAIKHNDKAEGKIKIDCIEKEDCWQFSVLDNGPGIDPLYQEKVFNFFQTLKSKENIETIGMGLPIVKKIIHHHGGNIWIESSPGNYCNIFFTIPKNTNC
ncbi:MAG: hypothetical protein A2Y40_07565 [Candidatus Margulisbacteria bacterium GWF2_35_9]|nr:MAG: hypothetical protein A2Y40_07565 [Candidatus Margulisbacteria bacterium GWF2_35_9]